MDNEKCTCPSGDGSLRWPCPAHATEAKPSASAAPGIDVEAMEKMLGHWLSAREYYQDEEAEQVRSAWAEYVAHIDVAIAAAREEGALEREAHLMQSHAPLMDAASAKARIAKAEQEAADLRARLAAPEGEAVAWACWADGKQQKPEHMHLCSYEPKAYPNRRALTWLQAKAPQQPPQTEGMLPAGEDAKPDPLALFEAIRAKKYTTTGQSWELVDEVIAALAGTPK